MFGRSRTARRLDASLKEARELPYDPENDRYVIFSDLHMADRSPGVDSFSSNEVVYLHALQHYLDEDFNLVLNGDVEEGWEVKPRQVREAYRATTYAMERRFVDEGGSRHTRIWGNHDDLWRDRKRVNKHLVPVLGEGIQVYRGLKLGEHILITHGHQGDIASDTFSTISRWSVRYGWRWVQKLTKLTRVRAATNHSVRRSRDKALYRWARDRKKLLIAGHTHRPMFGDVPEMNDLVDLLNRLEQDVSHGDPSPQLRATVEYLRSNIRRMDKRTPKEGHVPCYFNGGSCLNADGITGIELDRGTIRLVAWKLANATPRTEPGSGTEKVQFDIRREVFEEASLTSLFERIEEGVRLPGGLKDESEEKAA